MEREFFASCLSGLEAQLAEELKALGIERVRPLSGGVAFFCVDDLAYRACLWSRLASRILLVVGRVDARDADALYAGAASIRWRELMTEGASFSVRAQGTNEQLRNTRFTSLKVKDAIADCLREREGGAGVSANGLRASIDVRIRGQRATISLDLSGEALNHRPYLFEEETQEEALACSLAAGAIALSGAEDGFAQRAAIVDPVCREGIMLVEAASVACDRAPNLGRAQWGFRAWRAFDEAAWRAIESEAEERFERRLSELAGLQGALVSGEGRPNPEKVRCIGLSTSSPLIAKARKHIRRAGLRPIVSVELGDASDCAAAVRRVQDAVDEGAASDAVACLVASNLASRLADERGAQSRAERAAFLAAARSVNGELRAVALDGEGIAPDFPLDHVRAYELGKGRSSARVSIANAKPVEYPSIQVTSLSDGTLREVEAYERNSEQFAARLRKVARERRKWAHREGVSCYRLYDADLPDYAVAIDWYEGAGEAKGNSYLHIAEYAPPASVDPVLAQRRFNDVLAIAPIVCGVRPDHVFAKRRTRAKGGEQYSKEQGRAYATTVDESGLLFEVDLSKRLDTGLFLDHRPIRQRISQLSRDKRFLNLFAYTGAASVFAAHGGAASTTTVDLSQSYLDWARRNMEANGFAGKQHVFEHGDVMRWLTQARRNRMRFDLVFVDPPTFSNSKSMGKRTWDVQRDHVELLINVAHVLDRNGMAIFSCNLRSFKPDLETLAKHGIILEDISEQTIPKDFERTPKIHKCYVMHVDASMSAKARAHVSAGTRANTGAKTRSKQGPSKH